MSNRVIKFRAWEERSKKMFYDLSFYSDNGRSVMASERPLIDAILLQFTGLHDKNSKEIYEGDRLVYNGKVYDVTFNQDYSGYCLDRSLSIHGENESIRFDCDVAILSEVKGNIYQNPELLSK